MHNSWVWQNPNIYIASKQVMQTSSKSDLSQLWESVALKECKQPCSFNRTVKSTLDSHISSLGFIKLSCSGGEKPSARTFLCCPFCFLRRQDVSSAGSWSFAETMAEMHVRLGQLSPAKYQRKCRKLWAPDIQNYCALESKYTTNRFYSCEKWSAISTSHYSLYFAWTSFTLLRASTEIIFDEMIALWGTALFVIKKVCLNRAIFEHRFQYLTMSLTSVIYSKKNKFPGILCHFTGIKRTKKKKKHLEIVMR